MMENWSLYDAEHVQNPYTQYAKLREHAPVYWHEEVAAWLVTDWQALHAIKPHAAKHSDVVFGHTPKTLEARQAIETMRDFWREGLFFAHPDSHAHIRSLMVASQAYTTLQAERHRLAVQEALEQAWHRCADQEVVDFAADVARQVPAVTLARFLGIPEADIAAFVQQHLALTRHFTTLEPPDFPAIVQAISETTALLREVLAFRRQQPGDDMLSALLQVERNGERLSEEAIIANVHVLWVGGRDTLAHMMSSALLTLLDHPDARSAVRTRPDLRPAAREEILRYAVTTHWTAHMYAMTCDMRYGEQVLHTGDSVWFGMAAVNRDPAIFANPDQFDITRKTRHLAFGSGDHACLGAALTRMHLDVVIEFILRRHPDLTLAGEVVWNGNPVFRGLTSLPVRTEVCPA